MITRKTVVVVAILAAGAVGACAGYALGRHEKGSDHRSAAIVPRGKHVYTLHEGDVVRVPATATRCEASGEAGIPNLFCSRIGPRGRFQVVFWNDGVDLYDLARHPEPMLPTYRVPAKLSPSRK